MTLKIIRPAWSDDNLAGAAALLTSSNVAETDYAAWSGATAYTVGQRVILASTHRIYECAVGNTGKNPPDNLTGTTPAWFDVSATNKFKMFDAVANTQTLNANTIDVVLTPGRINSLYLGGLSATSVDITQKDGTTVIYTRHVDLAIANVFDWYQYFYEPIVLKTDLPLTDLPAYATSTLEIVINNPGATAACGTLVVGMFRELGEVQWKPSFRLTDYSGYQTSTFGSVQLLKRPTARLVQANVYIDNYLFDEVNRLMAEYTSVNLLWSLTSDYGSLNVYGFKKDFDATLDSPDGSYFNLQIQGLV